MNALCASFLGQNKKKHDRLNPLCTLTSKAAFCTFVYVIHQLLSNLSSDNVEHELQRRLLTTFPKETSSAAKKRNYEQILTLFYACFPLRLYLQFSINIYKHGFFTRQSRYIVCVFQPEKHVGVFCSVPSSESWGGARFVGDLDVAESLYVCP